EFRRVGSFQLGGNKKLVAKTLVRNHAAEHILGVAIGRRRIDELATGFDERPDDQRRGTPGLLVVAIKPIGGTETDRRDALSRARGSADDRRRLMGLR